MRLAITGVGLVSPLGIGWQDFRAALSGVTVGQGFGISEVLAKEALPNITTAEVHGFEASTYLGKKGHRNFDRLTKFLIVAAQHCLVDAQVKKDGDFTALSPEQIGICSATAYGSLDAITELNRVAELEDPRYINPARFPNTVINAAAGYVSIWEDLRAPNTTVVDGNCGSLDAVLVAETHLSHRRGDAFLVGGGEVISEPLYLALRKLGVVATPESAGITLGEGACYFLCERPEDAAARGRASYADILGYSATFDAPESEAVLAHASVDAVRMAIEQALAEAELSPDEVDLVMAASSGLPALDLAEEQAIKLALPGVAAVATKTFLGEAFGVAGAFGVASLLAYMEGVPPLLASWSSGAAPKRVRTGVVVNVGYYGNASAIVVRKSD